MSAYITRFKVTPVPPSRCGGSTFDNPTDQSDRRRVMMKELLSLLTRDRTRQASGRSCSSTARTRTSSPRPTTTSRGDPRRNS